jgi:hypothetical protein
LVKTANQKREGEKAMKKVSIIIPVIRKEKAERCKDLIIKNVGIPSGFYEIILSEDTKRIGCPKMVKWMVKQAKYDYICFLGDDAIPQPYFLKNALKAMSFIDNEVGLVSFNDLTNRQLATHWLAHKDLLPMLDGEFFHTGYTHCFCDNELMSRCQQLERYIFAYDAIVQHDHPLLKGEEVEDPDIKRVYAEHVFKADQALFMARMRNSWKTPGKKKENKKPTVILIGIPSGRTIHATTAMSLVAMATETMIRKNVRIAVVNQQSSLIEIGRCHLAETALELKADYLFTVDSDMVFPKNTLIRLLKHNKAVVCCDASRRMPPFTSVVKGLDGNLLDYDKDLPELVELSCGTSACQLTKVSVFEKIKRPFYDVQWSKDGKSFTGEDYYFTKKLRKAGVKTWCDTIMSLRIGHIGEKEYYINQDDE